MSLPDQHIISTWNQYDGLASFVGNGRKGNLDGRAAHCKLYQPLGICTEFDNVAYIVDYRSSCVKIVSSMINTAKFLGSIGKLMRAFSIHDKKGTISKSIFPMFYGKFGTWNLELFNYYSP